MRGNQSWWLLFSSVFIRPTLSCSWQITRVTELGCAYIAPLCRIAVSWHSLATKSIRGSDKQVLAKQCLCDCARVFLCLCGQILAWNHRYHIVKAFQNRSLFQILTTSKGCLQVKVRFRSGLEIAWSMNLLTKLISVCVRRVLKNISLESDTKVTFYKISASVYNVLVTKSPTGCCGRLGYADVFVCMFVFYLELSWQSDCREVEVM